MTKSDSTKSNGTIKTSPGGADEATPESVPPVSSDSGLLELFKARELAHYAARFRDRVFVIALADESAFRELLLDIKVLLAYGIRLVLVLPDPAFTLERLISVSNKRGTRFNLSLLTAGLMQPDDPLAHFDLDRLASALEHGQTPIITYHLEEPAARDEAFTTRLAGELALQLEADKLFLVSATMGALIAASPRSHVVMDEIGALRGSITSSGTGVPTGAETLDFAEACLRRGIPDIILLEARAAALFREVFTHDGAGLLLNQSRQANIRQARTGDITDIALLLKPEIDAGRILPIDENDIERNIHFYYVYEIDGLMVGFARLKEFGEFAEVAQFATLQRYRGKGRAKELANHLAVVARHKGCRAIFALSVDERMWELFRDLGFRPIEREALPEAWRENYDMARPSRALIKDLA